MDERLSQAAFEGDVEILAQIMSDDNLILDKVVAGSLKTNALHVAISMDRAGFVTDLLQRKEELAELLDSGRAPLHLAAAKGNVDIVKALINASKGMCLALDRDGRNPIHIAAMKGNVDALKELVEASPNAARVKLHNNETILHLCVKHGQLETLRFLLDTKIGLELINSKDSCGNTILHLAVSGTGINIVKHIVIHNRNNFGVRRNRKSLELNAENAEGHTALYIAVLAQNTTYEDFLRQANCHTSKDVDRGDWITDNRDTLMVVASLIATMAFQAAVSLPAGVWQEDKNGHRAGEAVVAHNYPDSYSLFIRANMVSFVTSLSMLVLVISGVPFKNTLYRWYLVVLMYLMITATTVMYVISITVVTPKKDRPSLTNRIKVGIITLCILMACLLVYHTGKLIKDKWDDYRSKYHFKANIEKMGYGDIDKATDAQSVDKHPPNHIKGNPQPEIQMV